MKKTNNHIVDEQEILRFNMMRENLSGKEFNRTQMLEELKKKMAYNKSDAILRALSDGVNPPIIKVRRGVYCMNPKPVYRDRLQTAWETFTKFANPQNYKTGAYKQAIPIEEAIKVLKEAGYKVLKPVVQYEEI